MLTRGADMWLVVLAIAVMSLAGCAPHSPSGAMEATQPAEKTPLPGGVASLALEPSPTAEKAPAALTAEQARQALAQYQLPAPTDAMELTTWGSGSLDAQRTTLNNWVKYWIKNNCFWPEALELAMNDPNLLRCIHARVITGADGSSFACVETTNLELTQCYIPPTDPVTNQFYDQIPQTLPDDTFIGIELDNRSDGLTMTSDGGRPALMDDKGKIVKVLGADSKFKDYVPPSPFAVESTRLFNNMPANAAEFEAGVAGGKYVQSPSSL